MKKRVVNVVLGSMLFGLSFFAGFGLYGVVSAHESAEVYYEQSQDSAYSGSIDDKAQVSADEEQVFVPEIGEAAEEVIGEGEN